MMRRDFEIGEGPGRVWSVDADLVAVGWSPCRDGAVCAPRCPEGKLYLAHQHSVDGHSQRAGSFILAGYVDNERGWLAEPCQGCDLVRRYLYRASVSLNGRLSDLDPDAIERHERPRGQQEVRASNETDNGQRPTARHGNGRESSITVDSGRSLLESALRTRPAA